MIADQPASVVGRRLAARALSGVRSAPYLRKWLVLGALIGIVAGIGAVVFFDGLQLATRFLLTDLGGYRPASTIGEGGFHRASGFSRPWAVPLVVAGGGLLSGLLVFRFAPEAEGHGTDAAIHAVHTNPKGVRPRVIGVKLLASMLTIGSGGSGGREGPTAQISSGFGSVLARSLNLSPADSRICVAAGIASGIGAVFRAPLGGALLGVELMYVSDVEIEALLPSLIATVVGYVIFCAATGSFTPIFGSFAAASIGHAWEYSLFILVGLACGLAGRLYTRSFYLLTDWFSTRQVPRALKPALAGGIVGVVGLAVPGVLGTGYGELQTELDPRLLLTIPLWIVVVLPLAKAVATGLSIGSGGSGGVFGPGLVVGGATGALVWRLLEGAGVAGHDGTAFVIVGMAAGFGAVAHAPISVLLMVAEMTGSLALLPPAMVAIAFAAVVVGDLTIYRSQLRRRSDSPAHRFEAGLAHPSTVPVAHIMSAPRLVLPSDTPAGAALVRLQQAALPGAPVVNGDGEFIGNLQVTSLSAQVREGEARTVGRLADVEAMTLPLEAGLDAAVDAIAASKGGWVPVLDDAMTVVGMVAAPELVRGWREMMRRSASELTGTAASATTLEGAVGEGAPAAGLAVKDLRLPTGSVIVSTSRDGAFLSPDAAHVLRAGDTVTILTRRADVAAVRELVGIDQPPGPETPPTDGLS